MGIKKEQMFVFLFDGEILVAYKKILEKFWKCVDKFIILWYTISVNKKGEKIMEEKEIWGKLHDYINTERGDLEIEFDKNIILRVYEHKHEFNDGYTMTYQSMQVDKYYIDLLHADATKMIEQAKEMQRAIAEFGIEKAVESLTREKNGERDRMWLE